MYLKRPNLQLTGIPEREGEIVNNLENIFEDIVWKFPNRTKEADMKIQEIQNNPGDTM